MCSQFLKCIRVPDSIDLEWGPKSYVSKKFSGDTNAAGSGTTPWELTLWIFAIQM